MMKYLCKTSCSLVQGWFKNILKSLFLKNGAKLLLLFDMSKFFGKFFFEKFLKFPETKSHFTHYQ